MGKMSKRKIKKNIGLKVKQRKISRKNEKFEPYNSYSKMIFRFLLNLIVNMKGFNNDEIQKF